MTTRSISVRLSAEVNQFKADMASAAKSSSDAAKKTETAWDQSSSHMGKMMQNAKQNERAWDTAGGVLTAVGGGIAALGVATTKAGIEFNALNQTATAALTSVMGSAEGAARQMDRMNDFGRGTWVMRDSLIRAQQTMTGFGIETQKVIPYMDSLAETVAATGGSNQDFEELARVMGKVNSSGKITGETFNEFGTRGVDAAALIGESMDMTAQEIRESVTDGTLDAGDALDALAEGMKDTYDGASANIRDTFTGAFADVAAAFRDLSASLAEPLVSKEGGGLAVDGLNLLSDGLNTLRERVDDIPGPVKIAVGAFAGLASAGSLAAGGFLLLAPRIIETQKAFQILAGQDDLVGKVATGMQRLGPALKVAGKMAGVAGIALAGIQVTNMLFPREDIARADNYVKALEGVESGSEEVLAAIEKVGQWSSANDFLGTDNVNNFNDALDRVANPTRMDEINKGIGGLIGYEGSFAEMETKVSELDRALADMVDAGNAAQAAEIFHAIAESNPDLPLERLAEIMSTYTSAAEDAGVASETAAGGVATMTAEAIEAQEKLQEIAEGLASSGDSFLDFADKATDAETSLRDWIAVMEEQVDAQQNWFGNLETLMGRGAPQEFIDFLMSLGEEGAFRVKQLSEASEGDLQNAIDAFVEGSGAAGEFASSVTGLPDINLDADASGLRVEIWDAEERLRELKAMDSSPAVDAQITALEEKIRIAKEQVGDLDNDSAHPLVGVSGADQSKGKIKGVHDALINVGKENPTVKVTADTDQAESVITTFWNWLTKPRDLGNGKKAEGYRGSSGSPGSNMTGKAAGGAISGPGSGTSDDIPTWMSNGEHVWTAEEVRRAGGHSAIYSMRRAIMSGDMPGFAAGGAVASARGDLARAERDLERIQKQGRDTTASDRKRETAQKRVEREREALRRAEEAQARRERINDLQTNLRTDVRRGGVQDQITGSLSGGYSAVDRMSRLGQNEDLSASSRNMANRNARKFESDLRRLYGQAERVEDKLKDAQDVAKELEGIQSSVANSIGRNAYDLDVTSQWAQNAGGVWSQTSGVSGVRTNAAASAGRAKALAQKLNRLQKMGYAGAILQEVAQAGSIEASIEMADALLEGSGSDVSSINDSYASIEKYANQAGKYVTGGFYEGGVDAAQGVVSGLESQQKNIESQIERLAKGMESVFKRVLGIRSPSRVMAELGVFTAEGLVEGMLSGQSAVSGAASMLAGSAIPNMRYDIDMTANPVMDTDAGAATGAMQDMSAVTLIAMQEMQAAVGAGWENMLLNTQTAQAGMLLGTQEAQQGMLTDTTVKQFSMRDITADQQEQMRAVVQGKQAESRNLVATEQETMRTTVADRQLRTRQNLTAEQETMRRVMSEKQTLMRDKNRTEFESMRSTTGEKLRSMRSSADSTMSGFSTDYDGHMNVMKEYNRSAHSTMESASKAAFRGIRSGMNEQMREARPELGSRMNSLIDVLSKFTKSVNTAFGDVGVDLDAPKKLSFATGGVMPGYTPGRDVHHFQSPTAGNLYLSGGEAIMRPEFTRAIGGEAGVREINALARGGRHADMHSMLHTAMYANGGVLPPIPGVTAFADSGVWRSLFGAVQERFPNVGLHSAYRPGAITATGNRSQHGLGNAIDISPRMDIAEWIRENFGGGTRELIFSPMGGRQINRGRNHMYTGVTRSMHFDHIHWAMEQMLQGVMPFTGDGSYSGGMPTHPFLDKAGITAGADLSESYREAAQKLMTGIMDKHVGQLSGMPPMMQDLGKGIMGKAQTGLIEKAEEHGDSMKFVMPGGEGVARWRDTVTQALRYAGLPQTDDYIGAWLRQIQSESGGNPNIRQGITDVNSGGNEAMGLVQVIPGTFAAYRDKSLPNDRTHPLANLVAGMNWAKYKAGRQGRDMLSFIGHGHGYKDGTANAKSGWAVVGEEGPELLKLKGGERIESNQNTRAALAANRTFIPNQSAGIDAERLGQAIAKALPDQDIASALDGTQLTLNVDGQKMTGFIHTAVATGYQQSKSRIARSSHKVGAI